MKLLPTLIFILYRFVSYISNHYSLLGLIYGIHRDFITKSYIRGEGIEIGALHNPLRVFGQTEVKYIDRMPAQELRKHYPELDEMPLVKVDIIDDGERLEKIGDSTQDFVIANHFLEHCQNPILAMENMLRVLKKGGLLYLTIPNKEFTFDTRRPVTSLNLLIEDYNKGPKWSKRLHYDEWANLATDINDKNVAENWSIYLMNIDFSIHFHVWDRSVIFEFINFCRKSFNFSIKYFIFNKTESLFLLKR